MAKRKVTKRESHPACALCGLPARKVRGRVTGFVDSPSCADAKLACIHASHPAGFSSTRPPLQRGPGQSNAHPARTFQNSQANCRSRTKQHQSEVLLLLCFCFQLFTECGPRWPAALPGVPCAAVRRGRQAAQREATGRRFLFARAGGPFEKPGPGSRTCWAGGPTSAKRGGLLFGYFLLATPVCVKVVVASRVMRLGPVSHQPARG